MKKLLAFPFLAILATSSFSQLVATPNGPCSNSSASMYAGINTIVCQSGGSVSTKSGESTLWVQGNYSFTATWHLSGAPNGPYSVTISTPFPQKNAYGTGSLVPFGPLGGDNSVAYFGSSNLLDEAWAPWFTWTDFGGLAVSASMTANSQPVATVLSGYNDASGNATVSYTFPSMSWMNYVQPGSFADPNEWSVFTVQRYQVYNVVIVESAKTAPPGGS